MHICQFAVVGVQPNIGLFNLKFSACHFLFIVIKFLVMHLVLYIKFAQLESLFLLNIC